MEQEKKLGNAKVKQMLIIQCNVQKLPLKYTLRKKYKLYLHNYTLCL